MTGLAALAVSSVGLAATTSAATAAGTSSQPLIGHLLRADPHKALPREGGTVTSLNWSGYAVTPSSHDVSAVTTSFTVPTAGLIPPGFGATWTGIGGYDSSDLIQAGASENSLPSNVLLGDQYYAWYELLPNSETQISGCSGDAACTVTPGDKMTVAITRVAASEWRISIVNAGHWTWTKEVSYDSSRSSAEWITESPSIDSLQSPFIAPLGTVAFGPSTYTAGGKTKTIAEGDPTEILLNGGQATPSALATNGESFDVCTYHGECALT